MKSLGRWVAPAALLVLALVLRWIPGGTLALGVDDGGAILTASPPFDQILGHMLDYHEVHPPLYFYYLHLWLMPLRPGAFEHGGLEAWFRFGSLPWALLAVYLTYGLGRALGGERVGVAAGVLAAVSNYLGFYALELRMYAMVSVFILGAAWAAVTRDGGETAPSPWMGRRREAMLVVCCVLAFFTHYEAVFFIAALGLFCATNGEGRRWLIPAAILFVVLLAWAPMVKWQASGQAFTMRDAPSWPQALELFFEFCFGVTWPAPLPGWGESMPAVKYLGLLALALVVGGGLRADARARRLLFCVIVLPLGAIFAISTFTSLRIFEYKYLQPSGYFVCIALAMWLRPGGSKIMDRGTAQDEEGGTQPSGDEVASSLDAPNGPAGGPAGGAGGVVGSRGMRCGWLVVGVVIVVNLAAWAGFVRHAEWYGPQDWRDVVADCLTRMEPGEVLVVHPSMMAGPAYVYAFFAEPRLFTREGASRIVPADAGDAPQLVDALSHTRRAWLLTTLAHPFAAQQRLLEHLPAPWKATFVAEQPSYWPANRIQVFLLTR